MYLYINIYKYTFIYIIDLSVERPLAIDITSLVELFSEGWNEEASLFVDLAEGWNDGWTEGWNEVSTEGWNEAWTEG
jgi:hypothetical protein